MSDRKVKEVDSIYSGGSKKRSRIFDDISCSSNVTAIRWTSIFSCCWKRNRETKLGASKEYNPNEWDYIVEKLVVKRVPLALYATEEDFQEFMDQRNYKESSYGPPISLPGKEMRDKQVYSAMQGMGSTLYFLKNKSRGDLSNKPSSKNLRFNRDEDLLDEDALAAGPSNYNRDVMREEEVENQYLNQFSALHPHLKESERPPKDPHPVNPPRGKRSLAENLSEIASTKKSPNAKTKKAKERNKQDSKVYITVSDTSREISTVLDEEETPVRDKNVAKHTPSISRKIGSTSCLPYSRKRVEVDPPYNKRKSPGKPNDRDSNTKSGFKAFQFKTHYVSPEKYPKKKVEDLSSGNLDGGFESQPKNYSELSKSVDEEFATDAVSHTSEDIKNVNQAGTTLRWKIIIKHHQPTGSQTASESASDFPAESSTIRMLDEDCNGSKMIKRNTEFLDATGVDDKTGFLNN